MTIDYLPGTDIRLYQRDDMFKLNTDTHLLGTFIDIKPRQTILDIGCNNGALLLYCQRFAPQQLIGVEILAPACALAERNLRLNGISNFEIINADFMDVRIAPVDVIVVNPPYERQDGNQSPNPYRCSALYEGRMDLPGLFRQVRLLLKDNGRFFMIHRAARLNEIMYLLKRNDMTAVQLKIIFDPQKQARTILIEAVKAKQRDCRITYAETGATAC